MEGAGLSKGCGRRGKSVWWLAIGSGGGTGSHWGTRKWETGRPCQQPGEVGLLPGCGSSRITVLWEASWPSRWNGDAVAGQMHLVWERVQAGNVTGIVAGRGEARWGHVGHSRLHAGDCGAVLVESTQSQKGLAVRSSASFSVPVKPHVRVWNPIRRLWAQCCVVSSKGMWPCSVMSDPANCSLPGSTALGVFQARILEWAAISSSRESSQPRDRIPFSCVSCIGRWVLYHWATREAFSSKGPWWQKQLLQAPPMSPLGMNRIRAPGLTAFRELLPSGLVSFLPTSCWLEAQAPPSCLQPPGPGFWDSLGESKALILLYLPGVKNVLKSVPHRSWRAECFQQVWGERWGMRFLHVQGLPSAEVCAFSPASQLPMPTSQEVRIQGQQGRGPPSISLQLPVPQRGSRCPPPTVSLCVAPSQDMFRGLSTLSYHALERPL